MYLHKLAYSLIIDNQCVNFSLTAPNNCMQQARRFGGDAQGSY